MGTSQGWYHRGRKGRNSPSGQKTPMELISKPWYTSDFLWLGVIIIYSCFGVSCDETTAQKAITLFDNSSLVTTFISRFSFLIFPHSIGQPSIWWKYVTQKFWRQIMFLNPRLYKIDHRKRSAPLLRNHIFEWVIVYRRFFFPVQSFVYTVPIPCFVMIYIVCIRDQNRSLNSCTSLKPTNRGIKRHP